MTQEADYSSALFNRAIRLCAYLLSYHFVLGGVNRRQPLTQREIARGLGPGWSQSTVSRCMWIIFPNGGMREYEACFWDGTPLRGLVRCLTDGSRVVDGVVDDDRRLDHFVA